MFLIFVQSRKFPYWTHCSTPLVCLVIEGGTNTIRDTPHNHFWDTFSLSLFWDTLIFLGHALIIFWDTPLIIYSWGPSPILFLGHTHVFYFWGHKIILFFRDTPHYYFWDNTSILFLGHLHCLFLDTPSFLILGLTLLLFLEHILFTLLGHHVPIILLFSILSSETPFQYIFMTHNILCFF